MWQQFQPELRAIRYTLNRDLQADTTIEFSQQPRFDELTNVETNDFQQIDLEVLSQQPAATVKDLHPKFGQKEEHFPAFLEVFIPLQQNPPQSEGHLVIWCRPNLLPKVTALWEHAAALLVNQS